MSTTVKHSDRVIVEQLYPALRRFAAMVAPIAVEPDDLVREALSNDVPPEAPTIAVATPLPSGTPVPFITPSSREGVGTGESATTRG